MKNSTINIGAIRKVASALGALNEEVVYVGGAVVSLYINDSAADDVRPTKDIDITLEIASLSELEKLREDLAKKGFNQSSEDDVICRFRYEDLKVDVMSTKEIGWAPANPWFAPGFKHLEYISFDNQTIRVLSLPYFLATKFTAFASRGGKDPRTSHDFEDIVYILDNRTDLIEITLQAPNEVLEFLKGAFAEILSNQTMQEAILGNLYYETQSERFEMIMDKIKRIVQA
ncbi:nucleotidyl transferase AbiEii/AbiGii toxin family protein [Owenweeksia hongkongensis]|uniref:nucleotidyl transferase AbiEii/AbiGii toxin family protein n=1 Tax=Owenweeksia hongkongensis TaxID=253245 RepID=UPI003A90B617